jgi:hypothetical protein
MMDPEPVIRVAGGRCVWFIGRSKKAVVTLNVGNHLYDVYGSL